MNFDAIVLGAGGAGLMCAATAGQRGRRVLVIDHNEQPGRKILISGGGRCNFTNLGTAPDRFLSANPHFAKSALKRYPAQAFIDLVDRHQIAWHEKTLGQLFCDGSARQIVRLLLDECPEPNVQLALGKGIDDVTHNADGFTVRCGDQAFRAPAVVVATGGPSIPKIGATDFAYQLANRFKLPMVPPRPALVPLTLPAADALFQSLSGVATEVMASVGKTRFRESALFTHRGLSGPAILQVSSYWQPGQTVNIQFVPDAQGDWLLDVKRNQGRMTVRNLLRQFLPARPADALLGQLSLSGELNDLTDKTLRRAQQSFAAWPFHPAGTEGYAKAEVTAGGIATQALSSRDMQAKEVPGLYVIGEAVDVTGWLGGYNFQWAWASGYAAGQAI